MIEQAFNTLNHPIIYIGAVVLIIIIYFSREWLNIEDKSKKRSVV